MPLENIEAGLAKMCPLSRVAVPQDIGRVVAFLASEEGEWINGLCPLRKIRGNADAPKAKLSSSAEVPLRRGGIHEGVKC